MNEEMREVLISKQEKALINEIYKSGSKFLCLDIPPTKTLVDKKLIVRASVCNETIDGRANYFHFSLSDDCRKAIKDKKLRGDIIIMPAIVEEKKKEVPVKTGFYACSEMINCKAIISTEGDYIAGDKIGGDNISGYNNQKISKSVFYKKEGFIGGLITGIIGSLIAS